MEARGNGYIRDKGYILGWSLPKTAPLNSEAISMLQRLGIRIRFFTHTILRDAVEATNTMLERDGYTVELSRPPGERRTSKLILIVRTPTLKTETRLKGMET